MIKLKSVIYLISMMTLAGCSGQKQASVAVEEQSGQWILGPFVRPEGVNPVISPQPTTFQCPMPFGIVQLVIQVSPLRVDVRVQMLAGGAVVVVLHRPDGG